MSCSCTWKRLCRCKSVLRHGRCPCPRYRRRVLRQCRLPLPAVVRVLMLPRQRTKGRPPPRARRPLQRRMYSSRPPRAAFRIRRNGLKRWNDKSRSCRHGEHVAMTLCGECCWRANTCSLFITHAAGNVPRTSPRLYAPDTCLCLVVARGVVDAVWC